MSSWTYKTFSSALLQLNDHLKRTTIDYSGINVVLDELNAFNFPHSFPGDEASINLIIQCCTAIPPNNSLLVAKSCHLILNHLLRNRVTLSNKNLKIVLIWVNEAIHKSTDVAFLDILQLINVSIKNHPDFFTEQGTSSLPFLFEKLESKASVLLPTDIKLWRVYCLQSLSKIPLKNDRGVEIEELLSFVYTQQEDNLLIQAQIWRIVVESLDCLVPKGNSKWILNKLNDIIGLIEAACVLGLKGKQPLPPQPVFPTSFFTPEPLNEGTGKSKNAFLPSKKKLKSKAKRVSWINNLEKDEYSACDKGFEFGQTTWLTSDSEFSDNELGQKAKLAKEQAKTRHSVCNLIIRLANNLKGRQIYGYFNVMLNSLIFCLRNETSNGTRIGGLAAISALLMQSKPLLSQAQHSEGLSYLGFSGSLSDLVSSLHSCLGSCLEAAPPPTVLTPLLQTCASLLTVAPYHRLRPNLLTSILQKIYPYLHHKDIAVRVGALKCLNELASLEESTEEQKEILRKGLVASEKPTSSWLLFFIISILKEGTTNGSVRLTCWQIIGSIFKNHFELLGNHLSLIEDLLFIDLKSTNPDTQLYATYALNKFLEALSSRENLVDYNEELWLKLLNGPLITLLQSPEVVASEACDCLPKMGPTIFNRLKDEEQILVMTLIFGCVNHEKTTVKIGAVHALGFLLLFPQITANEQFLFDAKDLLVKSLSDENLTVRIKGAWAIGNLIDLIVNNRNNEPLEDFNLKIILKNCLTLTKDDEVVRSNILRAIGLLLYGLTEECLDDECYQLLEKSVQFLLKSSSSGSKMKIRWNACHAISTMLKNKVLLSISEKWMFDLIQTLCKLIISCSNFKVRANACTALCQIPSRPYFGALYIFVWTSLLDGLDNSVNMPDFREYKHQDSLKQHLCSAISHIASLMESDDLVELKVALNYRLENLKEHLAYFQTNTLPEQTAISIGALNNIHRLIQSNDSHAHREFLSAMKNTFSVVQLS